MYSVKPVCDSNILKQLNFPVLPILVSLTASLYYRRPQSRTCTLPHMPLSICFVGFYFSLHIRESKFSTNLFIASETPPKKSKPCHLYFHSLIQFIYLQTKFPLLPTMEEKKKVTFHRTLCLSRYNVRIGQTHWICPSKFNH